MMLGNYQTNIDVKDEYNLVNNVIEKSVLCNCDTNLVFKKKQEQNRCHVPPLAAAILGLENTAAPLPEDKFFHGWTDIDAQESYIEAKPTCYLILGKPGAGAYSLGEAMSKKLNCIHICPRNIIVDEIDQHSYTGNCMVFNMKHNKVLKHDTIFSIIKKKLESPAVKHRGYIISGLPLVTCSHSEQYLIDELYSEESLIEIEDVLNDVILNLKKKKGGKGKGATSSASSGLDIEIEEAAEEEQDVELEGGEEEEKVVELPKFILDACSDIIFRKKAYFDTKKSVLLEQLKELMNLLMEPDIIVYISCPDEDIIIKKKHKYINYTNNLNAVDPFVSKNVSELRWPTVYAITDYVAPYSSYNFNPKYSCRQPNNFEERSLQQICNYKHHIFPFVEKKLQDFDPKLVIKLDGRTSCHQMMHHVMERLLLLPVKPVLLPEPLYLEEPPEEMEEFWKSIEELNVIRDGVVAFNRYVSPWYNRCPVQLKKRTTLNGNPKFAVTFFRHVYVLSSLDAMISFCRNPRPFLKLKYLEPTCRVIVMGTKLSGKTMIATCLSWVFNAPIICYKKFLAEQKQKKYDTFARTILSEIIATLEDARFVRWQNLESQRMLNLDTWYDSVHNLLRKYVSLLNETLKPNTEEEEIDLEILNNLKTHKDLLFFLPFLDDINDCNNALCDKKLLLQYAPANLVKMIIKPAIPAIGDEDVTEAIAAYIVQNELQKEIEPTAEELMNEIIKMILDLDENVQKQTNYEQMFGKWIIDDFPSDPEFWALLAESKLLPDYTIALTENREIQSELLKHYATLEKLYKNYQERFLLASDPIIKVKLDATQPLDTKILDMQIIVEDLVRSSIDFFETETEDFSDSKLISFTESIEKFRENWDVVKVKLEENFKSLIEVELEEKSDVQILDEVLFKIRKCYNLQCISGEDDEPEDQEDENDTPVDLFSYNYPQYLCETNLYCPIAYYDYGILWEGKPDFRTKYNNKMHYFCKEECLELFQKDLTKYQFYNKPFKKLPPIKICVIGCTGTGKTTISKFIAKELGLIHVDFSEIINEYLIPKHMKRVGRQYENIFTDVPIDEETVIDFQMDEENQNLESDILSNETELRRMVYNYFERGTPLIPILMQKLLKKLWFTNPFSVTGFVLDGFPRLPSDVEDMIACFCVPDLIIELESSSEMTVERLSTDMFRTWKMQLNVAKNKARKTIDDARQEWMDLVTKKVVTKLIYDEILDNMFFSKIQPVRGLSKESAIIDVNPTGSTNIDTNLFNSYNEILQEYPEPVDENVWEKSEDAKERISSRLESLFEVDEENIQSLKDILLEQKIKLVTVDAKRPFNKISRVVLSKLSNLRNRCESFFEQTFIINNDIAEMVLQEGFCFLSKFNRMCPVYIFENPDAIQNPYKISKQKRKIFTVVHRSYVYFISNKEYLKKFRTNPLKYISSNNIKSFIEYPLRIGVIGPPKSGKSSLVKKLADRYGLLSVSRGAAIRNVLDNLHWTKLALKIKSELHEGKCISTDLIIKSVHTATFDTRATYGLIFDGFPESASEAMELTTAGLYPQIVFDLNGNEEKIIENSQNQIYFNILKRKPPYPTPFIKYRYTKWSETRRTVRDWIMNDVQNLKVVNANESRWFSLESANKKIQEIVFGVHNYLVNVNSKIVPVDVMCISNDIFSKNMSGFEMMCPVCLKNNVLRHSNFPVNRKNVMQFKNKFYWACDEHIDLVMHYPDYYILSNDSVKIPEIPAVVKTINMTLVYENGVCIVTYAENLPAQKIIRGINKFAANYKGKIYLFCSGLCLEKFLAKPHMYYDITVFKETKLFPDVLLKKLPNLGYLEQTVGNILTEACCYVNVKRPKYPGLSIQLSALLHVALFLKTKNPFIDKSFLSMYSKAFKIYEARCKLILDVGMLLRSMDNPLAKYPQCCIDSKKDDSETLQKPSSLISCSTNLSVSFSEFNENYEKD